MIEPNRGLVVVVLGTRPEIIKLGHLIRLLGARVIHTGQHYDVGLSDPFFTAFGLERPETLGIGGLDRASQIGQAVTALGRLFTEDRPDLVVVQGDTNSTLAGALAANALGIPLAHVEAGLRSFDRRMPEEHNRVLTDHLADYCFAPTETAAINLKSEGIERIWVTGNTIVEAVQTFLLPPPRGRYVLSTFHRPENVDDPRIFGMILDELDRLDLPVILPLHPRARVDRDRANIEVIEPVDYPTFLGLMAGAALVVSDSGGVQEEVSILKRPMIVVRRSTERPEVLGTFATLIAPGPGIARLGNGHISDPPPLEDVPTPYGDGLASERIARILAEHLVFSEMRGARP
jgi:UDP-N-acetylglucosamine 2-epimerase (non-hydrolysing)